MIDTHALKRALEPFSDVRLAYVFGSAARGEEKAGSDLDVAVLLEREASPKVFLDVHAALQVHCDLRIDLADLRTCSPLLLKEVVHEGEAFFCRDETEQAEFEIRAIWKYMDTQHLRNVQHEYLREWAESRRGAQG